MLCLRPGLRMGASIDGMANPVARPLLSILLAALVVVAPSAAAQNMIFEIVHTNIESLEGPDVSFGDFDNDGDMDLLVGGKITGEFPLAVSRAYFGLKEEFRPPPGGGLSRWERDFTPYGRGILAGWLGGVRWSDINNDGTLEAIVLGSNSVDPPFEPVGGVYFDSGPQWVAIAGELQGMVGGSIDVGDYNNDGAEDVLVTGSGTEGYLTVLYTGSGRGTVIESGISLPAIGLGDGRFGDFDGDGDLDIFLIGDIGAGFAAILMQNDGEGFVEVSTTIDPLVFANADWGDYDADGDYDLVVSGARLSGLLMEPVTSIYRNDGGGTFVDIEAGLEGSYYGTVKWGDFDNDGDLDVVEVGSGIVNQTRIGRIYANVGNDQFGFGINLMRLGVASLDVGDYDGDSDLDLIEMGEGSSALYRNEFYPTDPDVEPPAIPNGRPMPPDGLTSQVSGSDVVLSWQRGSDAKTRPSGLKLQHPRGYGPERFGHRLAERQPVHRKAEGFAPRQRPQQAYVDAQGPRSRHILLERANHRHELHWLGVR